MEILGEHMAGSTTVSNTQEENCGTEIQKFDEFFTYLRNVTYKMRIERYMGNIF